MTTTLAPALDPALAQSIAHTLRFLSADGVQKAKSGHPGLPMGCAEIAAVLLTRVLSIDPDDANWINRDRFVLSAGHGSMLLYSMLYMMGFLQLEDLQQFRQLHSRTPGHPEFGDTPGVDMTTGPLGAGFAAAVGFAMAERMLGEQYNTPKYEVIDHYTYVLMGDGCHMEGITQEAASLAGHLKLGRLIAIYDDNKISIEGSTDLAFTESVADRYKAMNWQVLDVNGHDQQSLAQALDEAQKDKDHPSLIIAHTIIGKGAPKKAGTASAHGEPLGEEELAAAKRAMDWPEDKFYVPENVAKAFEARREVWKKQRAEWNELFDLYRRKHPTLAKNLLRVISGELPQRWTNARPHFPAEEKIATRASGGKALNAFAETLPEIVGGSADLAPSTKTEITTGDCHDFISPGNFYGRNIHFGVREHAMGQITNGICLHGGFRPFCSTFFVFHDYMRPALRLAALMKQPVIHVYTHDSIFVGEDGPTHQPIEHLASIRAMPNVDVVRPADANECAYAWQHAIARREGPTVLIFGRQNLRTLDREKFSNANGVLRGGYILDEESEGLPEIVMVGTGSELHLALEVASVLREAGRKVRIISMPCLELFKRQTDNYRKRLFPKRIRKRVVFEAGVINGWEGILGDSGVFIGMNSFGTSGPAEVLADYFGFTCDKVIDRLADADY